MSKVLEEVVATGKVSQQCAFGLCLGLESVITSSERLDMPFTFRMTQIIAGFLHRL